MREPVRVFSDLHLGHKLSRIGRVESLRPLIAGAGTVIFNGDTWQELAQPFRERSAVMLAGLRRLCADEVVDPVFLPGNHDPGWPGCGWVELAEGRIVVTHGDALLYESSPWKREIMAEPRRVRALWDRHPSAEHDVAARMAVAREVACELGSVEYPRGRRFIQRAWDAAVPPQRAWRMLHAWLTQGSAGAEFCQRYFPKAEVLVIGHFHFRGTWRSCDRLVINTGSFMSPGRAEWLEWSGGILRRGLIAESSDACRMGRILGEWRLEK
jgi:predicted phosphodiesterase